MHRWLGAPAFADLAGISERKARLALRRARAGNPWRGASLIVRQVRGVGGRSGRVYQVRADTLPAELQQLLNDPSSGIGGFLKHGPDVTEEREWWLWTLQSALRHARHSKARGEAIRAIAGREHYRAGKPVWISERTIQKKLKAFESSGDSVAALGRRKRRDAGQEKVIVTKRWDAGVTIHEVDKQVVADALRNYVRGLLKAGESLTWIRMLAARKLAQLTAAKGFDPGEEALTALCAIPANFIRAESVYRKVHRYNHDRKAYEDARPRIQRSRGGLSPMDVLAGDIHPLDILVRRDDGSIATPRMIAWLDLATNRIWADLVLLEKGEGIRNAHVIASFVSMVRAWGAPRALYIDNGGEYNFAEFIDDALKLIDLDCRRYIDRISPWSERESNIVRAQPYNAAAKPIEGIFGILERHYFSTVPGWIGGERMKKKTANVGREPEPFPGTFEELRTVIASQLAAYDVTPQRGSLKGRAPRAVYAAAIADGWGMTAIEADTLRIAFATEEPRQVRQGRVRFAGRLWTCPELFAYQGDRVSLLIPKYEDWSRLPVRDDRGRLLGFAEPDREFALLDASGALESKRRADAHRAAVAALDRSAPDVVPIAERAAFMAELSPPPTPGIAATIGHSAEAAEIATAIAESPSDRETRHAEAASRRLRAKLALIASHPKEGTND